MPIDGTTPSPTFGYLVIAILQVAQVSTKFWTDMRNVVPKMDKLYYGLISEKSKLITWATQTKASGPQNAISASSLLGDQWEEVLVLLARLQHYMNETSKKHQIISKAGANSDSKVRQYYYKSKFIFSGYNDLNDTVDTMKAMNRHLYALAPPPPPYVEDLWEEINTEHSRNETGTSDDGIRRDQIETTHVENRPRTEGKTLSQRERQNEFTDIQHTVLSSRSVREVAPLRTDELDLRNAREQRGVDIEPSSASDKSRMNLYDMYNLCHRGLHCTTEHDGILKAHAELIIARLKLWGVGLFDGSSGLDSLLKPTDADFLSAREILIKHMVILLSHLDIVLKVFVQQQGIRTTQVLEVLIEIEEALADKEAQQFMLDQWQIKLEDEVMRDQLQTKKAAHGSTELENDSNPETDSVILLKKQKIMHLIAVGLNVEKLFELLPVIEILQQKHWRRAAWKMRQEQENAKAEDATSSKVAKQPITSSEVDFGFVQRYIQNRDEQVRNGNELAVQYEPIFKKEQERLLEYERTVEASKRDEIREQVQRLLESMVQDIQSAELQLANVESSSSASPPKVTKNEKADARVLASIGEPNGRDRDSVLRDFLESYRQISQH